jgi:serine/threonine protein kinase
LKVADLGIPTLIHYLDVNQMMSDSSYMAPEWFEASSSYSFKSEIWSVGCIFFELLCKRHPFKDKDVNETVANIKRGKILRPSSLNPSEISSLIRLCLNLSEQKRPSIQKLYNTMKGIEFDVQSDAGSVFENVGDYNI